jgi:hypothetical protein
MVVYDGLAPPVTSPRSSDLRHGRFRATGRSSTAKEAIARREEKPSKSSRILESAKTADRIATLLAGGWPSRPSLNSERGHRAGIAVPQYVCS